MLYSSIFIIWLLCLWLIIPIPRKRRVYQTAQQFDFAQVLGYKQLKQDAEDFGWQLSIKEFIQIVLAAIGVGVLIAFLIGNIFFIIAGIALSYALPRYILLRLKRRRRIELLMELPDNLKLLTSKLMDFSSLQQAIQSSLEDMDGQTKEIFEKMNAGLKINLPVETILQEAAYRIKIYRFNDYVEKLLMANSEGFHEESIKSLKETIENISLDIQEIKKLEIKSKSEKKRMYIIIGGSWFLPFVLSFLSVDNANVFLDSWHGQIFIVSFFITTLYAIAKGDEYLSLNLDEL